MGPTPQTNFFSDVSLVLIAYLLLLITSVASQVLFACAAYQDAKSFNNKDATLWAVLIGLFGWIPGIIYLCIRKMQPKICRFSRCAFIAMHR